MSLPPRFVPGVIDYDGRMSTSYQAGRALSAGAAGTWRAIVAPYVAAAPLARLLDLGAGAGRFARLFAESFKVDVVALEPANGMRLAAMTEARLRNLGYVGGTAERIPLGSNTCGLVWMSHVWHHVRDREACVREIRRVLHPKGRLLIRGTFGDCLDGFPVLFRYWPGTRDVCAQLPTIHETLSVFEAAGVVLARHERVQQQTSASLRDFAERSRWRADSALALLSDAEFQNGQRTLEAAAARERSPEPVLEAIEFLVLRPRGVA